MQQVKPADFSRIAQDLQIRRAQVESVVQLLDEGNTVPFITRYRKERTGGLNEDLIRHIQSRVAAARQLVERKQIVLKSIEGQGKLTDELRAAILAADHSRRLEDLYLPFKPRKRTLATVARERGLEPLALAIWNRESAVDRLDEVLATMINPEKELPTVDEVRQGVQHLLAELIAENAEVRAAARTVVWTTGKLTTAKSETLADGQGLDYKDYFQFVEPLQRVPPHRVLAINRGEKAQALKVRVEWVADKLRESALSRLPLADHPHAEFLRVVADDALVRLLLPSLEREVRRELTEMAAAHAIKIFARNLRSLLLQPPLRGRRLLAIDPGFRTGCKLAALDETGNLLEHGVIFPHQPQNKRPQAKTKLEELVRKHELSVIAIGNGTACRETEELVAELIADLEKRRHGKGAATHAQTPPAAPSIPGQASPAEPLLEIHAPAVGALAPVSAGAAPAAVTTPADVRIAAPGLTEVSALAVAPTPIAAPTADSAGAAVHQSTAASPAAREADVASLPLASPDLAYVIVNEAGASVYSASAVGREEFPDYDATLRGTISIGRRLQDPLSELVKIDPQNIGVGLYQHDIHPRHLKDSLEAVVESSVNQVGIDLNTASVPLLRHVSGMNQLVAREVVEYRKQHGPFKSREGLLQVPNVGPARFTQAAGFLKVLGGDNPLDRTWVHPESYPVAHQILSELGHGPETLEDREKTQELQTKLKQVSPEELSARLQVGAPTLRDILDALARPGRDPRDDLPPPVFKKGVLRLEDLQPGMELKGTVLNVVDFGAFVDVGLKDSGLVHISQMANRYIKNPYDVAAVGDVVMVWVMAVDQERRRVSLTMIKPGTERRPPERSPAQAREGGRERPQRGRRPAQRRQPPRQAEPAPAGVAPAQDSQPQVAQAAQSAAAPAAAARPAPPPRKPKRQPPKPKLSQAAAEGKAPLRSFRELEVFFEAQGKQDEPSGS
jgi:uncharacterized protein